MEQLESTEKRSLQQHPSIKEVKSRSFRQKNGLNIAKLDIEAAKHKMFESSIQSPMTISSQKSNKLVPGLSEDSDASFDTINSTSPKHVPKVLLRPNQMFAFENSP